MDCAKIGRLIAGLRKEKGLTQQNIAEALNITNKTVSKWECGLGCPDISLWPELSVILGVEIKQMLEGEIIPNKPDIGNIEKIRFHVCPSCRNILISTGGAAIFCCGRKIEPLMAEPHQDLPPITVDVVDGDYFIEIDHPMSREHYLLFAAIVKSDQVSLKRLYPEQSAACRLPYLAKGKLYLYCIRDGLMMYKL